MINTHDFTMAIGNIGPFLLSFFLYLILHFLWSETKLRSINMQKSTRTIINLLDETSLVNIKNYYMAKGDSRWARYAEPIFPARIANENTAFA